MIKISPPRSNDKIHIDQAWYRLIEAITTTVEPNSVATLADLAALQDVPNGNGRVVRSLKAIWMRDASSAAAVDGITVIVSADGGRWIRQAQIDPTWAKQTTWYVNSLTGNDEYDGSTSGTALQTLNEWVRRIGTNTIDVLMTVWIEVDCLTTDVVSSAFIGSHTGHLWIRGVPHEEFTGTVAFWSKDNGAGGANDPGTVELTGWDASAHVGRLLKFTSGTANNGYTWVSADLGAERARVGDVLTTTFSAGGSIVAPTNGDAAVVYSLPKVYIQYLDYSTGQSSINNQVFVLDSLEVRPDIQGVTANTSFCMISGSGSMLRTVLCKHNAVTIKAEFTSNNCSGQIWAYRKGIIQGGTYKYLLTNGDSVTGYYDILIQLNFPSDHASSGSSVQLGTFQMNTSLGGGILGFFGTVTTASFVFPGCTFYTQSRIIGSVTGAFMRVDPGATVLLDPGDTNTLTATGAIFTLADGSGTLTWNQIPYVNQHTATKIGSSVGTVAANLTGGASDSISVGIQGALTAGSMAPGVFALSNLTEQATELPKVVAQHGVLGNLYCTLGTAAGAGETVTVTVYVNDIATALTCSMSGAGTGAGITSNNDTVPAHRTRVAPGDRVSVRIVTTNVGAPFAAANLAVSLMLT